MARRHRRATVTIRSQADALPIVAFLGRRTPPGTDSLVLADRRGRVVTMFTIEPGTPLTAMVGLVASHLAHGERMLLVSNRTGEQPADRPDDELVWEELQGIARANDVVLLDWFITVDTFAFSLAEFAPSPAQWEAA